MEEAARIIVDGDSHVLAASNEALALLEMTLEELRALPPGGLSLEADREAGEGFEEEWRRSGAHAIVGAGTIRLLDGRLLRLRYLATPKADGTFEIQLEPTTESTSHPARTFTVGAALAAWRAAERRLEELEPGKPEWQLAMTDLEQFKSEYQRLASLALAKNAAALRDF